MTYIPNAREGENGYKDTDLKGERAAFLRGYDYLEENEDKAQELFSCIKHWLEMQRNEAAVALLDDQFCEESDAEFDKNDKEAPLVLGQTK